MNQIAALFKKEIIESIRNFKLIALLIVFMIFGIISPLTAILMPDIMELVMEDAGIEFELPTVTAIDSYTQFFSNVNQMGLVVMVIVLGSLLTNEFTRNTLVNLVTKGLKRHNIIIVKSVYAASVWTIAYFLSALTTYLYTIYYWQEPVSHLILAFTLTWLFGIFLISLIMLASAIFKSSFIGVLITVLATVILMMVLSIHPVIAEYLPQYLISSNIALLTEELTPGDMTASIIVAVITTTVMFLLSILIFDKVEI